MLVLEVVVAQHAFLNFFEIGLSTVFNVAAVYALDKQYLENGDNLPIFAALLLAAEVASYFILS